MKTSRLFISFSLVISMVLTLFSIPAYAVSSTEDSVFVGIIPTFEIIESQNGFTLYTYKNNILSSTITWYKGDDTMQKTVYPNPRGVTTTQVINISDYLTHGNSNNNTVARSASDWYYLKTAVYNSTPTISEAVTVWYRSTSITEEPYYQSIYEGTLLEDVVAIITACLIYTGINVTLIAVGLPLASYSAQIAIGAISQQGAQIVNGIIDRATSISYECVRYCHDVRGYTTVGKYNGSIFSGEHCYVLLNGSSSPQDYTIVDYGWSAYNAICTEFAATMWEDFHPGIAFPGIERWS